MNNKTFYVLITILIAVSILFWGFMFQSPSKTESPESSVNEDGITLKMYHGEGCMCCVKWAEYLEDHGVTVVDEIVDDLHQIKRENGVPGQLSSCHTAIVDGYVVEGHVPVEDIRRMLAEQPDAIGISVPGMPPNAPGMDIPVSRPYDVLLFDHAQKISVYNTHQ